MISMYNSLTKSLNPHIKEKDNTTWQPGWFTNQCCTCGAEFLGGARALECYSCSTEELSLCIMNKEEELTLWEERLNKAMEEGHLTRDVLSQYSDEELESFMDKIETVEGDYEVPEYIKTEKDFLLWINR